MLYHRQAGQGAPLILLHGLFGSLENLSGLARIFAATHTVYSVDLPDHGRSPHTDHSDLATMVDGVLQWMDGQDVSSAIVVGHSLGGKVAMELALRQPDRVAQLVVLDASPSAYENRHGAVFEGLLSVPLDSIQSRGEADAALQNRIADTAVRGFLLKNLVRDGERFRWRINLEGLYRGYNELLVENSEGRFAGPTLFVRAGQSDYIEPGAAPELQRRFPEAILETVEQAGHWLHAEQPEVVGRIIADFLQKSDQKAPGDRNNEQPE